MASSSATTQINAENSKVDEWPPIELCAPKLGILSQFSSASADSVAHVLIRELVERVDRPSATDVNCFKTDQEVEWVMQVVNHALQLPFVPTQCHDTLRAAVRIYLTWSSALTATPHDCCPKQLLMQPDRYLRKILEALRHVFLDRPTPAVPSAEFALSLSRQGAQIRTILNAMQHICATVVDEFRDECWSRSLLFLINVVDQLLSVGGGPNSTTSAPRGGQVSESVGCLMAGDLCHALFDCWLQAALNELVPSPSYWRTLFTLCWRCLHHVPLVECWARGLLQLSALLLRNLYGHELSNVHIDESRIFGPSIDDSPPSIMHDHLEVVKDVWLNMFNLLGNPAHFTTEMYAQIGTHFLPKSSDFVHFTEQTSLAFFLAVMAFKKMVDMFFDEPTVYIDFNESEELHCQWLDALMNAGGANGEAQQQRHLQHQNEWDHQQQQHRLSNMSSLSMSHLSVPNTPAPSVAPTVGTSSVGMPRKSVNADFPLFPSSCAAAAPELVAAALQLQLNSASNGNKVRAEQHVWYTLRNNEFKQYNNSFCCNGVASFPAHRQQLHPLSNPLLTVFLRCLGESALFQLHSLSATSTVGEPQKQQRLGAFVSPLSSSSSASSNSTTSNSGTTTTIATNSISGGNYCSDPAMLGAVPHQFRSPADFPAVEGVAAGRSTALAALCRIVCSKRSRERLDVEQLAQFFTILHEALISRDRLMLCALLYHTADELFKLALNGVQILLPNYVMAVDIVYTESIKLRLHPSVSQTEMRAACLRALASVLAWPSVFGTNLILSRSKTSCSSSAFAAGKSRTSHQGSSASLLETEQRYIDLRLRMQRVLVHSLRNESVPNNLQTTLALCTLFACESARYDSLAAGRATHAKDDNDQTTLLNGQRVAKKQTAATEQKENGADTVRTAEEAREEEEEGEHAPPPFSISLVRAIVSAVCDNLCKPSWASDTLCCLAAFDCLNCLSSLSHRILFYQGELSIGSLIITSLCRFIDQQLQKPPPHHSRDMHSTVVAAYSCMNVWLNAAPELAAIESCLSTVAQIIELGVTGGRDMTPEQYKPASQRVRDAAEMLLHSLFAEKRRTTASVDEFALVQKYGLDLAQFRHFYIGESTILSLYETQQHNLVHLSEGLPSVLAVFRTPFYEPWATLLQLLPRALCREPKKHGTMVAHHNQPTQNGDISSPCTSAELCATTAVATSVPSPGGASLGSAQTAAEKNGANGTTTTRLKQFEIPREVFLPQCKLDAQFPRLEPVPGPVAQVQSQLEHIRSRLAQGSGAPLGDRDTRNVWLNASLGALLSKAPTPESSVANCNSLRVFLYDMGLLNRRAFGREFTPLDNSSFDIFYDSLSVTVDQHPMRLTETVSLFYVRENQRSVEEILQNNIDLSQTSAHYCRLLCQLGKPTARKAPPRPLKRVKVHCQPSPYMAKNEGGPLLSPPPPPAQLTQPFSGSHHRGGYVLDGLEHFICWRDAQVEIAFITPTGRMLSNAMPSTPSALFGGGGGAMPTTTTTVAVPSPADALDKNNNNTSGRTNNHQPIGSPVVVPTSARRTTIAAAAATVEQQQQLLQLNRQKITNKNLFTTDPSTEFAHRTLQANIVRRELDFGRGQLLWKRSIDEIQGMKTQFGQQEQCQQRQQNNNNNDQQAEQKQRQEASEEEQEEGGRHGQNVEDNGAGSGGQHRVGPVEAAAVTAASSVATNLTQQRCHYVRHQLDELERDVPTCRATILTMPPGPGTAADELPPAMTMLTATNVIVRSARFSTKWRRNTLLAREERMAATSASLSIDEKQLLQEESGKRGDMGLQQKEKANGEAARQVDEALLQINASRKPLQMPGRDDHCDNIGTGDGIACDDSRKCPSNVLAVVNHRRRHFSPDASIDSSSPAAVDGNASWNEAQQHNHHQMNVAAEAVPFCETGGELLATGAVQDRTTDSAGLNGCTTSCHGLAVQRQNSIIRFIDAHSPPISPLAECDDRVTRRRSSIFRDIPLLRAAGGGDERRKSSTNKTDQSLIRKHQKDQQQPEDNCDGSESTEMVETKSPIAFGDNLLVHPLEMRAKTAKALPATQPATISPQPTASMTSYFKSFFRRTSKTLLPQQQPQQNTTQQIDINNGTSEGQKSSTCRMGTVPPNAEQLRVAKPEEKHQEQRQNKSEQFSPNTTSSYTSSKSSFSIGRRESAMMRNAGQEERRNNDTLTLADECHTNAQQSADRARTKSCISVDDTASTTSRSEAATGTTTTAGAAKTYAKRCADQRILVVWLERSEDMDTFPLDELLQFTPTSTVPFAALSSTEQQQPPSAAAQTAIGGTRCGPPSSASVPSSMHALAPDHLSFFLCPIERGLCRVQVAGIWTKYGQPGPLLNGTVVSMDALPALLRQTICNAARRKAAELENYQMTHVRRRHAIAEFGRRFPSRLNYTDFVEQLISDS